MVKSPSKFMSLEMLLAIRDNYYRSEKGVDYCASEVDELIYIKSERKERESTYERLKEFDEVDEQGGVQQSFYNM